MSISLHAYLSCFFKQYTQSGMADTILLSATRRQAGERGTVPEAATHGCEADNVEEADKEDEEDAADGVDCEGDGGVGYLAVLRHSHHPPTSQY